MTDIICPLCGKPNPPDLDECKYCQAPLKTGGFIAPAEGEDESNPFLAPPDKTGEEESKEVKPGVTANLEQAIPDWLKKTEASFLDQSEVKPEEPEEAGPDQLSEQIASLTKPPSTPDQISEQIDSILNQPATPDQLSEQLDSYLKPPAAPDQLSEQLDSYLKPPAAPQSGQEDAIDDDWLTSLLADAGAVEPAKPVSEEESLEEQALEVYKEETEAAVEEPTEEEPAVYAEPAEKPEWLSNMEASSTIKFEGIIPEGATEQREAPVEEAGEKKEQDQSAVPDWIAKPGSAETTPSPKEGEPSLAPAEIPGWLEALQPSDAVAPTEPVEDVSGADIVTAGPLVGLRGVISAHPSAIRAQKPPTYSIKLRVTEEQQARVQMMEELLADEEKAKPLPSQPIISSRNIFRLIVALVLLLPMVWMIIAGKQQTSTPQPSSIPGVVDFTQQIQKLPSGAPVLIAFDYEAGFSGELNIAITNVISQLMNKSAYLTLVSTTPSGPALAEIIMKNASSSGAGKPSPYPNYANLGYIPGGTMGLLGLATSPSSILPYSLDENNVWAVAPLSAISTIKDFTAVIVITNDADSARIWIEQVGTQLQVAGKPLLIVTSSQAEPLIRPYYEATPAQVQGLVAGLAGGVAYGRSVGSVQQNGVWDAFSIGITVSILIILIGSIAGVVLKMLPSVKKMGS